MWTLASPWTPCTSGRSNRTGGRRSLDCTRLLGICSDFHHEFRAAVRTYRVGVITVLNGMAYFVLAVHACGTVGLDYS